MDNFKMFMILIAVQSLQCLQKVKTCKIYIYVSIPIYVQGKIQKGKTTIINHRKTV